MNEVMLHPSRDFLSARNPSSLFQYKLSIHQIIWNYIDENIVYHPEYPDTTSVAITVQGKVYRHWHRKNLFDLIKHHWGI